MIGFAAPGIAELFIVLVIAAFAALITVLPLWMICSKAGFPGWISLVALVPILAVILLFYLAFAEWPALKRISAGEATRI